MLDRPGASFLYGAAALLRIMVAAAVAALALTVILERAFAGTVRRLAGLRGNVSQ